MPEPMIWLLIDPRNGRRGKVVARESKWNGPYAQECDPGMAASIPERRPTVAEAIKVAERMVARKLAEGFKLIEVA